MADASKCIYADRTPQAILCLEHDYRRRQIFGDLDHAELQCPSRRTEKKIIFYFSPDAIVN